MPEVTNTSTKAQLGSSSAESAHYLHSIRDRLDQLYALVDDPRVREHLSDEVDWVEKQIASLQPATPVEAARAVDPSREELIESIQYAIGALSTHIDAYHDGDYEPHHVPAELDELRRLQHHLEGSLINSKGEFCSADAAQPSPETCGTCMGRGYSNHPDSGEVCQTCKGQGVALPSTESK